MRYLINPSSELPLNYEHIANCQHNKALSFFIFSQKHDQANAQQSTDMNGVGGEQDSQHRNGKSDSKEDFGSEFYDTGEKSIFDGDDFELVGTYTGDSWRGNRQNTAFIFLALFSLSISNF